MTLDYCKLQENLKRLPNRTEFLRQTPGFFKIASKDRSRHPTNVLSSTPD
jgi:hypothetical protein